MKYLIVVAHPDDEVLGAGAGIKIEPYPQGRAPVLGYIALAGHGIAEKMPNSCNIQRFILSLQSNR